ncbi:hypothetical protein J2T60_001069 [Natronospira proteinivora]|uniref:Uncharacterized protein n=1 Tax=Natronospira proteinivora TaxID=1807133 RepID=A0ABT1G733_9GAMM|nr:hypothetical protein [Natronospira proteinivora]MCP1727104.1 hypothetical protein [Natronospira proteinivora]
MAGLLRGIWRLKWLLVAIMIVYFWLPTQAESRPDWQLAGERALMLMTLFAVVHTLLYRHSAMMVGAALAEGLGKLDRLGLPGTAFSRRLALLMEIALAERERLAAIRPRGRSWFRGLPRLLAEQIRQVEQEAASVEAEDRQFPVLGPSPWWQWLFLLFVWTMLLLVLLY